MQTLRQGGANGRQQEGPQKLYETALARRCSLGYGSLWDRGARPIDEDHDLLEPIADAGLGDAGRDDSEDEQLEEVPAHEPMEVAHAVGGAYDCDPMDEEPVVMECSSEEDVFGHGGSLDQDDRQGLLQPPAKKLRTALSTEQPDAPGASSSGGPRPVAGDDPSSTRRRERALPSVPPVPSERSVRRRITGKAPRPPHTEVSQAADAHTSLPAGRASEDWGRGHRLAFLGPAAWCRDCGRYAIGRVGRGPAAPLRGAYSGCLMGCTPLLGVRCFKPSFSSTTSSPSFFSFMSVHLIAF